MVGPAMPKLKGLLTRARKLAEDRLPEEVVQAGRRLRDEVVRRAPPSVADVIDRYTRDGAEQPVGGPIMTRDEPTRAEPNVAEPARAEPQRADPPTRPMREDPEQVLARVHTKAEHGLKPEDRVVVIYATQAESDQVSEILEAFEGIETTIRQMDLAKEPPQTTTQLAKLTGVMVPPWVYINGKYWGGPYEMISLKASGDLEAVVANRLDDLGAEARRIGGIHETFSEDITVENLLRRWKLGHILTVDDLDTWYEIEKDGTERFFHAGGPHPVEHMSTVAEEIVEGVEAEELEVQWHLEPAVSLS